MVCNTSFVVMVTVSSLLDVTPDHRCHGGLLGRVLSCVYLRKKHLLTKTHSNCTTTSEMNLEVFI